MLTFPSWAPEISRPAAGFRGLCLRCLWKRQNSPKAAESCDGAFDVRKPGKGERLAAEKGVWIEPYKSKLVGKPVNGFRFGEQLSTSLRVEPLEAKGFVAGPRRIFALEAVGDKAKAIQLSTRFA